MPLDPVTVLPSLTEEFLCAVREGRVPGYSMVHKFGRNDAVPNGTWAFVNLLGQTAWPLSAATTVRIKAGGNAADAAAGAGAREVTVQGIVATTFLEETDVLATAGASASAASTKSFWRVHRAWVSEIGTYGAGNTAAVTIENSAGGSDLIQIGADEGQSQFAAFTMPAGKTGYLASVLATVNGTQTTDIRCYVRQAIDVTSGAGMQAKRIKIFWDGIANRLPFNPKSPGASVPEKSDIWFEARGGAGTTAVSVDFELLVVD